VKKRRPPAEDDEVTESFGVVGSGVQVRPPRSVLAGLGLMVGLLAVLCLSPWPPVRAVVAAAPFQEAVQDAIYVLGALVVGARAWLVPRGRGAWAALACGLASYAAGNA
jgi:hypothetical protein